MAKAKTPPTDTATQAAAASELLEVALEQIVNDPTLQTRVGNDGDQIDNIKEALEVGETLPPIVLFATQEGRSIEYYIGDGWHRYFAHLELKRKTIRAEVRTGGRKEALKYALGANANHGLRRTNADKRKAVEVAHREFPKHSARQIAELCKVSHNFAAVQLKELSSDDSSRIGADGKERKLPAKHEQGDFFTLLYEQHDAFAKQGKNLLARIDDLMVDPAAPRDEKLAQMRAILDHAERVKTDIADRIKALEAQQD